MGGVLVTLLVTQFVKGAKRGRTTETARDRERGGRTLVRTPTLLLSRVSSLIARDDGATTMLWYFPIGVGRDGMYTEHHESGRLVWSVSYYVWTGWSDNTVHIG